MINPFRNIKMKIICKLLGHKERVINNSNSKNDIEPKAQICKRCGMLTRITLSYATQRFSEKINYEK